MNVNQPNKKLVAEALQSYFKWLEQERAAQQVILSDIPVVDGKLDFTAYQKAMEDLREARAGQAAAVLA